MDKTGQACGYVLWQLKTRIRIYLSPKQGFLLFFVEDTLRHQGNKELGKIKNFKTLQICVWYYCGKWLPENWTLNGVETSHEIPFIFLISLSTMKLYRCMYMHVCVYFSLIFLKASFWWSIFSSFFPTKLFYFFFQVCLSAFNLSSGLGATAGWGSTLLVTETQLFLFLSSGCARGFICVWLFVSGHWIRLLKEQFGR